MSMCPLKYKTTLLHIGQAKSLSHDGHIGRAIEKLPQTDGGGIDPSAEVR